MNGNKKVTFNVDIFYSGNYIVDIIVDKEGNDLASTCTCDDYKNNKILKKIGVITTYGKLLGGQDLL